MSSLPSDYFVQPDHANAEMPSMCNMELWNWFHACGIESESPAHLVRCFDVWWHICGVLFYRMKTLEDRIIEPALFVSLFVHDPLDQLSARHHSNDEIIVIFTHDPRTKTLHEKVKTSDHVSMTFFHSMRENPNLILAYTKAIYDTRISSAS